MEKYFVARGVGVKIPEPQEDRKEYVIEDKLSYDEKLKYKTTGFELIRLVINLGVKVQNSDPVEQVTLDPAMELVVALTSADIAHLDEDHPNPKLAYWHPVDHEWVDLNATVDLNQTKLTASIDTWWPDPGVGLGR